MNPRMSVSCGFGLLQDAVGGGFPTGALVEFYGAKGSGKRSMALAACSANGCDATWVELSSKPPKGSYDEGYAKACGWRSQTIVHMRPTRDALLNVNRMVRTGGKRLIVVAGISLVRSSTVPEVEAFESIIRRVCASAMATGATVLFLADRDGYDHGTTMSLNSLKFWCALRVSFVAEPWEDEGVRGIVGQCSVVKNKFGPVFARCGFAVQDSLGLAPPRSDRPGRSPAGGECGRAATTRVVAEG